MKEQERKELEKLETLLKETEAHPLIQKFKAEKAAETLVKRKAAADKIKDLELDLQACGVIQREIDELVLKLAAIDAERLELQNAINKKLSFMWREKSGVEGEIRHELEILYSCYDPAIDEAIIFFNKKLAWLRSPGRITHIKAGSESNLFTDTVTFKEESNAAAVRDSLKYCQDAIPALEKMKLTPEIDLPGIEALKAGIPRIDVYKEFEGERPMPKGPDAGFLAKIWKETNNRTAELLRKRV